LKERRLDFRWEGGLRLGRQPRRMDQACSRFRLGVGPEGLELRGIITNWENQELRHFPRILSDLIGS